MKIHPLFAHPHVSPNPYVVISVREHKTRDFEGALCSSIPCNNSS